MGGVIRLAAGPVRVARESSAGLLPVFGVRTSRSDEFLVRVGEPIKLLPNADADEAALAAARGFLGTLAPTVLKYPEQWRGWSALVDR